MHSYSSALRMNVVSATAKETRSIYHVLGSWLFSLTEEVIINVEELKEEGAGVPCHALYFMGV